MNKHILIIEDEEAINDLIAMNLQATGYKTVSFFDGTEVYEHLSKHPHYDMAILDIMLPGKDGFEILPKLKECGIPVMYLTAKGDIVSKAKGLTDGAEDYMVKPFEMLELIIRIDKILKRYDKTKEQFRIRDVAIYPKERKVLQAGKEVHLKPMEFECLMLLVIHKNMALTREEILRNLWDTDFMGETRTVDAHIGRIRKKLKWHNVIRTIPRIGYRLESEEEPDEA